MFFAKNTWVPSHALRCAPPFALQGQCNTGWGVAPPEMDVPFQRNTATT